MAANVNKVILVGRVGDDTELRRTKGGKAVANIRLATFHEVRQGGQVSRETCWHKVVVWGRLAEDCAAHLTQGRAVYVEGRLNRVGGDTEVVAERVEFLCRDGR